MALEPGEVRSEAGLALGSATGEKHGHPPVEAGARHGRRKHHKKHEEDGELWLVSYADMMTLLVGFFVILQSFSQIDQDKFEKVKEQAARVFGGEYRMPFKDLSNQLRQDVASLGLGDQITISDNASGVELSIRGKLFFDTASAVPRPESKAVLEKILPSVLQKSAEYRVLIEGHTDDVPLRNAQFANNWELSSMRACKILEMFEVGGFPRENLKAVGFADTQPLVPNRDGQGNSLAENQAQNRRVVIKIRNQGSADS